MSFWVAANWKMNKTPAQTQAFFDGFLPKAGDLKAKALFFVPAVDALTASSALRGSNCHWGPQNIYPQSHGAFTGENSPKVMKELGANYCLIGHSERRQLFQENDQFINAKVHSALEHGLMPLLCVGETLEERKRGETLSVIGYQLSEGLKGVSDDAPLMLAYEPVWAIGTGEVAEKEQVEEVHRFLGDRLAKSFPKQKIAILYGGSVKADNAALLASVEDVDGFLVGGASLEVESFLSIFKALN